MTRSGIAVVVLLLAALASARDLTFASRGTIVVYTTPALRDLLEEDIVPAFRRQTGHDVSLVYLPAGQQYNRLRMSGDHPEADLLVQASPLYAEKAFTQGFVEPTVMEGAPVDPRFRSREVPGGSIWNAFAWSPLVAVHREDMSEAPDLVSADASFGFPHPVLSSNGVYVVLFLEQLDPEARQRVLARTRSQPTNARANIGGITEGSFELTLGYEAVIRFFQEQGARIRYEVPMVRGRRVTTPVLFSVALVNHRSHEGADAFARFLFSPEVQAMVVRHHFRPVFEGVDDPPGVLDLAGLGVSFIDYDWRDWQTLEEALLRYEVK